LFGSYSHSGVPGYSAPRSRIAGRSRIMTSLSRCKQRWRGVQVKVLRLSDRKKGFWWSREDTVLLISQYRKHEKLFRNVNFKKKSVWELRAAENPRESGNHRHSLFASVLTTAVLREMTERNAHFTGKLSSRLQV